MAVVMQKIKQTMTDRFRLLLDQLWYEIVENRVGSE